MQLLVGLFVISLLLLGGCSTDGRNDNLVITSGPTMGTAYMIKLVSTPGLSEELVQRTKTGIDSLLALTNQQMSTFVHNSEISRFNSHTRTDWFPVSPDMVRVIEQSLEISSKSSGAFDITTGALVNLWGFGPEERDSDIPTRQEIRRVQQHTGYEKISVRTSPPSIKKETPETCCDLAGIAKGYAVDRIAEYLDSEGISDYLVEIGGEIRARGKNQQNRLWQVGIAIPDNESGIQKVVSLNNTSMATSGDYRNFYEKKGIRYSHIIDPRTGEPVTHKLASVTVIHDLCSYADALATAISVLGPDDGYELALKEDLAVLLIIKETDGFVEKMTPRFREALSLTG